MKATTTMFTCFGYQNVRDYSERGVAFPISKSEIPAEHAHSVMTFTNARDFSAEKLVEALKQAAGVDALPYELVD